MPQDPFLYGREPGKKKKTPTTAPSNMSFAAQMASLISSSSGTTSSKPRSKTATVIDTTSGKKKDSIFSATKGKRKQGPLKDESKHPHAIRLKSPTGTHDEAKERDHARQKMEAKAKIYDAMKRGERRVVEGERAPLVDFDTKWANRHDPNHKDYAPSSSSDSEEEEDRQRQDGNNDEDIVEWEDEFGRLRKGTRAEQEKHDRRLYRGLLGQEELERISARPAAPKQVIYGDTVQTSAFKITDETAMEELAGKRDRSVTPPADMHYDANWEIRDKGVGFYSFSQTGEKRVQEMSNLEKERKETEARRAEKEDARSKRKRTIQDRKNMIDERRRRMETKKAKTQADAFLDGLGMEMDTDEP